MFGFKGRRNAGRVLDALERSLAIIEFSPDGHSLTAKPNFLNGQFRNQPDGPGHVAKRRHGGGGDRSLTSQSEELASLVGRFQTGSNVEPVLAPMARKPAPVVALRTVGRGSATPKPTTQSDGWEEFC